MVGRATLGVNVCGNRVDRVFFVAVSTVISIAALLRVAKITPIIVNYLFVGAAMTGVGAALFNVVNQRAGPKVKSEEKVGDVEDQKGGEDEIRIPVKRQSVS